MPGPLVRWDPFSELSDLRTRFDRLFDELDGREHSCVPAIDVVRDDGSLVVHGERPAIKPERVKIEVEDDVLTVSGEHRESKDQADKHYIGASGGTGRSRARPRCRQASTPRRSRPRLTTASSK
jgi:HSP20 family molecular chaperone IbpA